MSRTRKDRPYWVLKNDPTTPRYATHDHKVVLYDQVDEEPVYRNALDNDGWHWKPEVWYTRPIYKRTVVNVDCTLDVPEGGVSSWRHKHPRTPTNEERLAAKNCYWWLEYYPNTRSGKPYKRLTNGAVRTKVRQQLHNAVRDNGRWTESPIWWYSDDYTEPANPWPEYLDWEDIDINDGSKYASRGWWDW